MMRRFGSEVGVPANDGALLAHYSTATIFQFKAPPPWAAKIDWAKACEAACPSGAGMDEKKASAMLLPSAALDIACPTFALSKAGGQGLERALSVALAWSNVDSAKELHQRLCVA